MRGLSPASRNRTLSPQKCQPPLKSCRIGADAGRSFFVLAAIWSELPGLTRNRGARGAISACPPVPREFGAQLRPIRNDNGVLEASKSTNAGADSFAALRAGKRVQL